MEPGRKELAAKGQWLYWWEGGELRCENVVSGKMVKGEERTCVVSEFRRIEGALLGCYLQT